MQAMMQASILAACLNTTSLVRQLPKHATSPVACEIMPKRLARVAGVYERVERVAEDVKVGLKP
jgi:hypothetical protein